MRNNAANLRSSPPFAARKTRRCAKAFSNGLRNFLSNFLPDSFEQFATVVHCAEDRARGAARQRALPVSYELVYMKQETKISRERMVELLNQDLAREYQAI